MELRYLFDMRFPNANNTQVIAGVNAYFTNVCITSLGTDGTWYGYESGNFGTANPSANILDQHFYSLKWKADGSFIISFGDLGNEQVPDVPQIFIYHKSQDAPLVAVWNDITTQYEGTDLALATTLIALQIGGATSSCFFVQIEPTHFISYDFNLGTV